MAASVPITDPALAQVLRELSDLRSESAKAHTEIRDSIDALTSRMDRQNGRVNKLEDALTDIRVKQAAEDSRDAERDRWHEWVRDRAAAFIIGAGLGIIGAVIAILY